MNSEFKKDLIKARELSRSGKLNESLEIYNRLYGENPEDFNPAHKDYYALTVYRAHVKHFTDEEEFFKSAEFVTELTNQKDTTNDDYCIYTITVFTVLRHLNSQREYYSFSHWLDKINPDLLGQDRYKKNGRIYSSNTESYYEYASKECFYLEDYEKCIEFSMEGLERVETFTNFSDTWHHYRIAKSLKALGRYHEALGYFEKVLEVKKEWYIYRETAETCHAMNNILETLRYLCPAVLSRNPNSEKVNLYLFIYHVFKGFNPEMALKHAQLYYILKLRNNARADSEIEDLNIDANELNLKKLEREIRDLWIRYRFRKQKLQHGTVSAFFEDKGYGFITAGDDSIFFHKSEFNADTVFIGQNVSFYTEKTFDKSKNRDSVKAVYISGS